MSDMITTWTRIRYALLTIVFTAVGTFFLYKIIMGIEGADLRHDSSIKAVLVPLAFGTMALIKSDKAFYKDSALRKWIAGITLILALLVLPTQYGK